MKHFSMDAAAAQAALGFLISQTSHIEAGVNATVYPDILYPGLVPVDTSAHPFAKTVTYFSSDQVGRADWLNLNADDVPLATTERTKHETQVHAAGIGYGYGWEELEHARMLGIPLAADDAMAARRAYEEMVDRVVMDGDAAKGYNGLLAYPGVTAAGAEHGNWASAAEDEILRDVNAAIGLVHSQSNTTVMANTVLLPWERFLLIAGKRLGDTSETILDFLVRKNIYTATTGQPLMIRAIRKLDEAGTSVSLSGARNFTPPPPGARMVAYRRDPQVLKVHIPMPHRFLPARQAGPLRFEVPGVFRLGGLDIRRPKEVVYVDGI